MRKAILIALTAALVTAALSVPAGAAKKTKKMQRKVELTYTEPAFGTAGVGLCFQGSSCVFFGNPAPKERYVNVEIEDDLGQPVYASVIQDTNGDGSYLPPDDLIVDICGKTTDAVKIEANKPVSVWIWQGPGVKTPCPGVASAGTVTATFSNLP